MRRRNVAREPLLWNASLQEICSKFCGLAVVRIFCALHCRQYAKATLLSNKLHFWFPLEMLLDSIFSICFDIVSVTTFVFSYITFRRRLTFHDAFLCSNKQLLAVDADTEMNNCFYISNHWIVSFNWILLLTNWARNSRAIPTERSKVNAIWSFDSQSELVRNTIRWFWPY